MGWDFVKKIRNMVAKAEDKATSSAEAEAIMVKVRAMLEKHGISLLTITDATSNDPVDTDKYIGHFWASDNWIRALSDGAGRYYGVRVVWHKQGNKTHISAVGRESCRAAYGLMLPYIIRAVKAEAKKGVADGVYRSKSAAESRIGNAMATRLRALAYQRKQAEAEVTKEGAGMAALVPVDEIDAAMFDAFPDTRTIDLKARTELTADAWRRANNIGLAEQVARAEDPTRQLK